MNTPSLGPSPSQITLMGHNIVAKIAARTARRRRTFRVVLATSFLAVGLGLSAAAIGVATAPLEAQDSAYSCFLTDDPRGRTASVQTFDDLSDLDATEKQDYAVELCTIMFGMEGVNAPEPTSCELPDLRLGVFPNIERVDSDTFCTSLGLGRAPTS